MAYLAAAGAAAFLMGSLPAGYLVAKARGIDIRREGSGNIGATNVFRVVGRRWGIFVFVVDALKGFAAVLLAQKLAPAGLGSWPGVVAGVAVIAGHNYTPWLGFRGGKGIATSAGVLLALMPAAVGVIAVVWGALFGITRYVSVASIGAALALPVAVAGLWIAGAQGDGVLLGFAVVAAGLAVWRHRSNLQRLRDGTEHRFGRKREGIA